jgi:hypothetical protein
MPVSSAPFKPEFAVILPGRDVSHSMYFDALWTRLVDQPGVRVVQVGQTSNDINASATTWSYRGSEVQRAGQVETLALFVASRWEIRQAVVYRCLDPVVNRQQWTEVSNALNSFSVDLRRGTDDIDGRDGSGGGFRPACLRSCSAIGLSIASADCLAMCRNK